MIGKKTGTPILDSMEKSIWDWLYVELDERWGPVELEYPNYLSYLGELMDKVTDIVNDRSWW